MAKVKKNRSLRFKKHIGGVRMTIEVVVAACHIISFLQILFDKNITTGMRWTLFTLCLTTFTTVIQFYNEAGWEQSRKMIFNLPFWGIVGVMFLIFTSYIIPQLATITENRYFAIFVSGLVATRQGIHTQEIYRIFIEEKKES